MSDLPYCIDEPNAPEKCSPGTRWITAGLVCHLPMGLGLFALRHPSHEATAAGILLFGLASTSLALWLLFAADPDGRLRRGTDLRLRPDNNSRTSTTV